MITVCLATYEVDTITWTLVQYTGGLQIIEKHKKTVTNRARFDEYENHMLLTSPSPYFNSTEHLWETSEQWSQ